MVSKSLKPMLYTPNSRVPRNVPTNRLSVCRLTVLANLLPMRYRLTESRLFSCGQLIPNPEMAPTKATKTIAIAIVP
jgi:hypothetical protein